MASSTSASPLSPEREAERERRIEIAYAHALLTAAIAGMGRDWRSGRRFFQMSEDRVAEAAAVVLSALDHARADAASAHDRGRQEGIRQAAEIAQRAVEWFRPSPEYAASRVQEAAEAQAIADACVSVMGEILFLINEPSNVE